MNYVVSNTTEEIKRDLTPLIIYNFFLRRLLKHFFEFYRLSAKSRVFATKRETKRESTAFVLKK